jgi:hypothetical protein
VKSPNAPGRWVGFYACVLLALTQSAHAASWLRAETRHFIIHSSVDEAETRQHIEQLEAFKYLAELLLGTNPKDTASSAKFTIYLLDSNDHLRTVRPGTSRSVGGYYISCVERSQAFVHAPQWFGAEMDFGLRVLLHEYSHHLMFSRMRRFYPSWYVEGFADYLSTTKLEKGSFQLGVRNEWRTGQLQAERWLDFDVMLDPKRFSEAVKQKKVGVFQFYAQSWLMAHYMLSDAARTQAFTAYFDKLGRGEDGVKSFESSTGMTLAQFKAELATYRRKFSALQVKVPDLPNIVINVTRVPKEEGDYLLESAALQSCPKKALGAKLLEQFRALRVKRANDVRLRVELARAELLFGDPKAAKTELESLQPSDPIAFDLAYLLGRIYYADVKEGKTEEQIVQRNKASDQFLKAYALDKTHAPNLYFLSKSLDTDATPSKAVVNAGTAAALLAPNIADYGMHAALVNLRSGDRATAMRVLQPFANNPHKLEYATQVSAIITSIRDNEEIAGLIEKLDKLGLPPTEDEEDDDKDKDKDKEKEKD